MAIDRAVTVASTLYHRYQPNDIQDRLDSLRRHLRDWDSEAKSLSAGFMRKLIELILDAIAYDAACCRGRRPTSG